MTDETRSENAYERRLDDRIRRIGRQPDATIRGVIRRSRGAFPTLVYERLAALELAESLPDGSPTDVEAPQSLRDPELHPLDFEWYFTAETATEIATELADAGSPVLCLGAPTVAVTLANRGVPVTLVDRNELVETRFASRYDALEFVTSDIAAPLELDDEYPVAFFDPPWYPEDTTTWLHRASTNVADGGRIYFVLFPPLTRPAAAAQRDAVLETAAGLGSVTITDGAVTYHTPSFEREVLRESAVPVVRDWRRGDLVRIDVETPDGLSEPPSATGEPDWETFVANGQVVKVRRPASSNTDEVLSPIAGCDGYVLPSVSRRDARRREVDLWTSRNRVAAVGDRDAVTEALRKLETAAELDELRSASFEAALTDRERDRLIERLGTILRCR